MVAVFLQGQFLPEQFESFLDEAPICTEVSVVLIDSGLFDVSCAWRVNFELEDFHGLIDEVPVLAEIESFLSGVEVFIPWQLLEDFHYYLQHF
jgi:hypothetical protein